MVCSINPHKNACLLFTVNPGPGLDTVGRNTAVSRQINQYSLSMHNPG